VLEPLGIGAAFTVELEPGRYSLEWFDVTKRRTSAGDAVDVGKPGQVSFTAPFGDSPSVLYLARVD
jgi:hypothetical protein